MDGSSSAHPLPRLRVSRDRGNASTASTSLSGPSRLPDFTQLVDLRLSDMHYADEDEEQDQYPTPKMNSAAPLTPSSATPTPNLAIRLRELIQLVPNGSTSQATPLSQRPSSPAFHESDFEGEHSDAGYSHARESLRDIFTKALREPGDTPQKGRTRKHSDDTSSQVDSNDWSDVKGKRTSLGDDANASSFIPRPSSHRTVLRPSRDSSAVDFPLKSISADDSDDTEDSSQARRRTNASNATLTSQSLHISQNSGFPQQSNLLDQDSEMHRAFGALESFDEPSTQSQKYRGMSNRASTTSTVSTTPGPSGKPAVEKSRHSNKNLESTTTPTEGGRRRTSLTKTATPSLKRKTSASLQFSDQSSSVSVSDYTERVKEMERERNREREREWNKRHVKNSHPGSSLSFQPPWPEQRSRTSSISSMESARSGSPHSTVSNDSAGNHRTRVRTVSGLYDRPRVVSAGNRPGSALSNHSTSPKDLSQGLRRHHSLTIGDESPDSKGASSEVVHERERNWNAPRPKWYRRSLPDTPDRPASPTHLKQSVGGHRNEYMASSNTLKDASNISRSDIKSPTTRRQSQVRLVPLSPSPAEKRSSTPVSNGKSSQFSRSPATPSRLKSHIPRPVSPGRQRSQPSSNSHSVETLRNVSDIEERSGDKNMEQAKSMVSFPSAVNGPSLYQESMELTEAYNVHEASSALPSFSDDGHRASLLNNDTMHTMSFSRSNDSQGARDELLDEDNGVAQERTPILQMLNPPSEEISSRERASPMDESYENFISTNEQHVSFPSVLSTPPRSRHDSKPQFQTPSPPKGLPDLPGPPSSPSGDENQESLPEFSISLAPADVTPVNGMEERLRNGNTTLKTPRPPGGWLSTPGPFSREQLTPEGSMNGLVESSDDGLLQAKSNYSRPMVAQTPMPPGGWMNTPAPHLADSDAESVINEGGLTTPVASLGRASNIPLKTPAPPGAWALTPATARKSALKVRFDAGMTNEFNGMLADSASGQTTSPTPVSEVGVRSSTPEPVTPITPPSRSPRKHKRSPSVRLVDAYGNEKRDDRLRRRTSPSPTPSSMRSKSGIRVVDALGQEVQEGEETVNEATEEGVMIPPMSRVEALQRVKLGIQELAEGIESLDLTNASHESETARLKELDDASQALKLSREQLMQNMQRKEKELRLRVRQKILRGDWLGRNAWFLFLVGVIQVTLVFMMYRASTLRARKKFLTNYYDPFNPDLFLYTTNPDTQYATPAVSWNLVVEAVRSGDLTAFTGACRTGLSILIKRLHREIWDVWGDDPNRPVGAWPPT